MKMNARRLNRRGTIKHLVAGQDAAGQPVPSWANLIAEGDGKVACNVRFLSGVETIRSDAPTSVAKASICIRMRSSVTAAMRFYLGDTVFEIKTALPDEEDRTYMNLACEVVTAGA